MKASLSPLSTSFARFPSFSPSPSLLFSLVRSFLALSLSFNSCSLSLVQPQLHDQQAAASKNPNHLVSLWQGRKVSFEQQWSERRVNGEERESEWGRQDRGRGRRHTHSKQQLSHSSFFLTLFHSLFPLSRIIRSCALSLSLSLSSKQQFSGIRDTRVNHRSRHRE